MVLSIIASVIAAAGNVAISPAGKMMIHNVSGQGVVVLSDMADYSDLLIQE